MDYQVFESSLGPVSYRKIGTGKRKILFFHGFPGSSHQISIFTPEVVNLDLEVICFDRPGYNLTKIQTNNSISDSLTIANELVAIHSWNHFEIVTVSGGTPFGVSYALRFPQRVTEIRVICGLGNLNVPLVKKSFPIASAYALSLFPRLPGTWIQKLLNVQPGSRRRNPFLAFFLPASKPDINIFKKPGVLSSLNLALSEALKQQALGPQQDAVAFLTDWSHGSEKLQTPIHFWHGELDFVISNDVAKAMQPLFPNSRLSIIKNEGHISLPIIQINSILNNQLNDQL